MSFGFYQKTRSKSNRVQLYFFRFGSQPLSYYAYTDAEKPITIQQDDFDDPMVDPVEYTPVPIDRTNIALSGTLDKAALTVMFPQALNLWNLFSIYPPSSVVTLVIRELEINDPDADTKVVWTGRVLGVAAANNQAKLTCEPISTSTRRVGLRRNFQHMCPLLLYGPQCRANKAANTVVDTPESFTNSELTFGAAWADVANGGRYLGGQALWIGDNGEEEIRTILRVQIGRIFLLSGLTRGLAPGEPVTLIRGCAHTMDDCNLFGNIQNFGGQPFIPGVHAFGFRNVFY